MKLKIKILPVVIALITIALSGCGSDDDAPAVAVSNEEQRVFFNLENVEIDRLDGSLKTELRYQGPKTNERIEINYTVSFPNENNAVEGEDYILPESGSFFIENGKAITNVVLLQRIINNENANEKRSMRFELQPKDGFIIGNTDNSGSTITVTFGTMVIVNPNDPEGFIGNKRFFFTEDNNTFKIPYFSNRADISDTNNTLITSAVIAVHGSGRNARRQYDNISHAAQVEGVNFDEVLLIAPQFVGDDEVAQFNLDDEHIFWGGVEWRIGDDAEEERISSFSVMDSLINTLSGYPNIKNIVLTGHSAGGQFTARYVASSPIADDLETMGITLSFVVTNPGTYTYMDDKRKVPGTENTFAVPPVYSIEECPDYNEYEYGLDDLAPYLDAIGEDVIRARLAQRKVSYLIGQNDNDPSEEETSINTECEAILQGRDRFERATNYFNHLLDFYGPSINENLKIEVVPNAGHSSRQMYQSEIGRRTIFRN